MKKAIAIGTAFMLVFIAWISIMPAITIAQYIPYSTTVTGVVKDSNGAVYNNSPPNSITITTNEGTWQTQTDDNGVYTVTDVMYRDDEDGGIIDPVTNKTVDIYVDFYANEPERWGEVTGHNNTKNAVENGITTIDIITDQLIPEFSTVLIPIVALIAIFGIFVFRRKK